MYLHQLTTTQRSPAIRQGFRRLAGLIALALLAVPAARAEVPAEKGRVEDSFLSGGKKVAVERYEPTAGSKYPAILLLPAIDGLDKAHGDLYRRAARRYADKGYVVLLVKYFDRTRATPAERKALRESFFRHAKGVATPAEEKVLDVHFRAWTGAVADAAKYASNLPNVDGDHVGLVGFSLGATVALSATTRYDLKLAALAEFFGTLPRELRPDLKKLPPTLIIHGEEDQVVPAEQAYILVGLLSLRQRTHEAEVYPGVGHMFSLDGKEMQLVPFLAASRRTDAFLNKHLRPGSATATSK
jgi:carboxymethylenebutenolidase